MPPERPTTLFKRGAVINLPDAREAQIRGLARQGFLLVVDEAYVRCVNARDGDLQWTRNRNCGGVALLEPDLDEDNGEVRCSECDRVLYPRRKERFRRLRVSPRYDAIVGRVRTVVERVKLPVTERPLGLLRIEAPGGEVHVCLVDVCPDQAVYHPDYERRDTLVFIIANDRDYSRRPPEGSRVYSFLSLLDGQQAAFTKELRKLAKVEARAQAAVPAVLAGPASVRRPATSASPPNTRDSTLPRLPVTPRRWGDVRVYMNNARTLTLCVPGAKPQHYSNDRLGMSKGKDLEPTKKWAIIEALCEGHGTCGWRRFAKTFDAFKNQVSELRRLLRAVVGLDGDPFLECSNGGGLRAAFQAGPPPDEETWVADVYPPQG